MSPTLLVLAAGMGSRYGGLKQIDPVGPSGETVLDYGVFDAIRAGFSRVVFVIRRDFAENFQANIGAKYAGRVAVDYVFQSVNALPSGFSPPRGREKPWGTGHAVWCAREAIRENFAVINADDFYGGDCFVRLAGFLRSARSSEFAMAGFRLASTLSEHGTVARGICAGAADGTLHSVVERVGIAAADVGAGKIFSGNEIVSMNCWGFTPALFPALDRQLREFIGDQSNFAKAEFFLPAAVSAMIARGEAKVQVLPTDGVWFGITYREDKPRVEAALAALVSEGKYPAKLFPAPAGRPS
jgi:NDP-sugar pyrophosphorylase family protein